MDLDKDEASLVTQIQARWESDPCIYREAVSNFLKMKNLLEN